MNQSAPANDRRTKRLPHPFPYQGSKRRLAAALLPFLPDGIESFYEPFAGSAAAAIAAADAGRARRFVLNDLNAPLMALWREILRRPAGLAAAYRSLWEAQKGRERAFFDEVRRRFNRAHEPADLLFLLARCVKAAVRYNRLGEFNNSPDKRRCGMHPRMMERNLLGVAKLLAGRTTLACGSFDKCLDPVGPRDFVYLDPPYQGVSRSRDHRYASGMDFDRFVQTLRELNARSVSYLVSYDGRTGRKMHGRALPRSLGLRRRTLFAGRSSQATLLGRHELTYESLYLSPALAERLGQRS